MPKETGLTATWNTSSRECEILFQLPQHQECIQWTYMQTIIHAHKNEICKILKNKQKIDETCE